MLEISGINYGAFLVASVISIAVGGFWYSPLGFGKLWSQITGIDMMKMPKNEANKGILFVALSALVQNFMLAVLVNSIGATSLKDGLLLGLLVWAGFTAATTVGDTMYSRRGWKLWSINSGFYLLTLVVNAIVLSVWN